MNRYGSILIGLSIFHRNRTNNSASMVALPSLRRAHLLVPVTTNRKSSARLASSGAELPLPNSLKMCSTIFLFSAAFMTISISISRSVPGGSNGRPHRRRREFSKHPFAQRRILVLPDLHDLAAGEPVNQAIVVVVANALFSHHVALGLDHDMVAIGEEAQRDRSPRLGQYIAQMAMQIAQQRRLALESLRPGILPGHAHRDVIGQGFEQQTALARGGAGEDCFHQLLVLSGAHGFSIA